MKSDEGSKVYREAKVPDEREKSSCQERTVLADLEDEGSCNATNSKAAADEVVTVLTRTLDRAARPRDFEQARREYTHPFFWAPFVLISGVKDKHTNKY